MKVKELLIYYLKFKKMKIQILGSGCPSCKNLYKTTETAVKELNINAKVEYINDITKLIEMGIMQSPALLIDNKLVTTGFLSLEKVKEVIKNNYVKIIVK